MIRMKLIFAIILRNLLKIFWIFPVDGKRIFFCSNNGEMYNCNPKYLFEYLYKNFPNTYKYCWGLNGKVFPDYKNCVIANTCSFKFIYFYMTAKVVVINNPNFSYLPLRKKQICLYTHHGGGAYKASLNKNPEKYRKFLTQDIDVVLVSSNGFFKAIQKDMWLKSKRFLFTGMPRNDLLFSDYNHQIHRVKEYYGMDITSKIVLYAPTWRTYIGQGNLEMDFNFLIEALENRFPGNWNVFVRYHFHYYGQFNMDDSFKSKFYDVSGYDDMQELLCAADVLITDYSSSIWDFSLMKKPCFLYVPDIVEYKEEMSFHLPIEEWPGIIAESNGQLYQKIIDFNQEKYIGKIMKHHNVMKNYDRGVAAKEVTKNLLEWLDD